MAIWTINSDLHVTHFSREKGCFDCGTADEGAVLKDVEAWACLSAKTWDLVQTPNALWARQERADG
jgi:hypothetical protein